MTKCFVILAVLAVASCKTKKTTQEFPITKIEVLPSGSSIVTTEYADSTTVVHLNKNGELLPDSVALDSVYFHNDKK